MLQKCSEKSFKSFDSATPKCTLTLKEAMWIKFENLDLNMRSLCI